MALRRVEIEGKSYDISYVIKNSNKKETVLILHGWGSDKELMKRAFANFCDDFRLLFIDLPGFGGSSNDYVLDTALYSIIVREFLKSISIDPKIVVGHSFGGKVALLLKPKILVLLSSAGVVAKKTFKVRAKIAFYKLLKPLGAKSLRELFVSSDAKGMPENMYETFKKVVDEDFLPLFREYEGRALLFWGCDDRATPVKSGKAIADSCKNSRFEIMEGDHYFFLNPENAKKICEIVGKEYEKLYS